jgi:hypothetical protein
VAPGGKGTLEVQFDSKGKSGLVNKQVNVRANTQPTNTVVFIKGNILPSADNGPVRPAM